MLHRYCDNHDQNSLKGCSYDPDGAESEAPKYETWFSSFSLFLCTAALISCLYSNLCRYVYKHADLRPWDPRNDVLQWVQFYLEIPESIIIITFQTTITFHIVMINSRYECDYNICTKTRHKTPMMRTQSIVSVLASGWVSCSSWWWLFLTWRRFIDALSTWSWNAYVRPIKPFNNTYLMYKNTSYRKLWS